MVAIGLGPVLVNDAQKCPPLMSDGKARTTCPVMVETQLGYAHTRWEGIARRRRWEGRDVWMSDGKALRYVAHTGLQSGLQDR